MKKLTLFFLVGIACSCNNSETASTDKDTSAKATPATAAMSYPYTIDHPDNWEVGNPANTMIALSSLKAWEEGRLDESAKYFGDSVRVQFDGIDKKMSNDSLKVFLGGGRDNLKTVRIKMTDWESVISKDKSEEWVTLWYRQFWEDKKGMKDSVDVINDAQIKDGKIVLLSESSRKLH